MYYLSTILAGIGTLIAVAAWSTAYDAARLSRKALDYCINNNKTSTSLKKMTELEVEMTEITDSVKSIHTSLHKLRSRIGMRDLAKRREEEQIDALPDSKLDPEGWKREMRKRLHQNMLDGR